MNARRTLTLRPGLTLVEVLLSIMLIGIVLAMLLGFFNQVTQVRAAAARELDRTQLARQVLDRLAAELRGCIGNEALGFQDEQRLVGTRRALTFITTALPDAQQYRFFNGFDTLPAARHDLRLVHYRLLVNPEETTDTGDPLVYGVYREEKQTFHQVTQLGPDETPEGVTTRGDLWAPELGYLEFRYYDGMEWATEWNLTAGNALPQMILITIGFDSITAEEWDNRDLGEAGQADNPLNAEKPQPNRYSLMVRLPAADKFFGSRVQHVGQSTAESMGVGGGR
jgi:type II secretory pathway component PulJ